MSTKSAVELIESSKSDNMSNFGQDVALGANHGGLMSAEPAAMESPVTAREARSPVVARYDNSKAKRNTRVGYFNMVQMSPLSVTPLGTVQKYHYYKIVAVNRAESVTVSRDICINQLET